MPEGDYEGFKEFPGVLRIAAAERIGRAVELMAQCQDIRQKDNVEQAWRESYSRYLHKEAELNLLLVVAVCLVKIAGEGQAIVVEDNREVT